MHAAFYVARVSLFVALSLLAPLAQIGFTLTAVLLLLAALVYSGASTAVNAPVVEMIGCALACSVARVGYEAALRALRP